jgi:four helix bundle protein
MQDFHNIQAWQKAHELTLSVYKLTEQFPSHELYGLTSQLRRAAYSIPMNIAEGCGRSSEVELARFLDIAGGSASELAYQLLLGKDLGLVGLETYEELCENLDHVRRMLTNLIKTVRAKNESRNTNNEPRTTNNEPRTLCRTKIFNSRSFGPCLQRRSWTWRCAFITRPGN